MYTLESLIIAAHRALPEDIRSAPATGEELAAFESDFGPIPPAYRWYLEHCGGGVAGSEWLDDIHQLATSHRKFQNERGEGGWAMRDVFIIGWDGGGKIRDTAASFASASRSSRAAALRTTSISSQVLGTGSRCSPCTASATRGQARFNCQ